ncbi:MAG: nucleotidyltransferase-like protein [Candidatus Pristimantibacillus lignocellulolyticus]|uniref:Nucleotidyltransferase-like protein n=1 Tax=Candidatus Pristimantibacillus lignocellulolyticus TaxID=2994561 RepID=A0A9J6Z8Y2_9BACL|nr:MAG: nucleotidyltransferase-like protein [Candidatus Pristimantibacillus lignocellulolyticus]
METIKKQLLELYSFRKDVQGLVLMHNMERFPFHTNEYVFYLLVVSTSESVVRKVEHLEINGERVFVRTVHLRELESSSATQNRYNLMDWLMSGEIIADSEQYLDKMKQQIIKFPNKLRDQRKLCEFSGYLETLFQAKRNLSVGNVLDAYSQILISIHHWANIVLIEEGIHPELTVWKQIRKVHPGVYKLYEELIASPETIEQRVELVMLACEFSVMSKMKICCKYLLDIMKEKEEPWSISELQQHPQLHYIVDDITLVVQKLVQGHHLKEVGVLAKEAQDNVIELEYVLSN